MKIFILLFFNILFVSFAYCETISLVFNDITLNYNTEDSVTYTVKKENGSLSGIVESTDKNYFISFFVLNPGKVDNNITENIVNATKSSLLRQTADKTMSTDLFVTNNKNIQGNKLYGHYVTITDNKDSVTKDNFKHISIISVTDRKGLINIIIYDNSEEYKNRIKTVVENISILYSEEEKGFY